MKANMRNIELHDHGLTVLSLGAVPGYFDAQDTLADQSGNIVYSPQSMESCFEEINQSLNNQFRVTPRGSSISDSISCGDNIIDIANSQITHPLFNRQEQKSLYKSVLSDARTIFLPKKQFVIKYDIAASLVAVGYKHMASQLINELLDDMLHVDIDKSFYLRIAALQSQLGQKSNAMASVDLWLSEFKAETDQNVYMNVSFDLILIEKAQLRPQDEQAVYNAMADWTLTMLEGHITQPITLAHIASNMADSQAALTVFEQAMNREYPTRYGDNLLTYTMIANLLIDRGFIDTGLSYYKTELDKIPSHQSFDIRDIRSNRATLIEGLCDCGLPVETIEPYFRQAVSHDYYRSQKGLDKLEYQLRDIVSTRNCSKERKIALLHILFEELLSDLEPDQQQKQMRKLLLFTQYLDMSDEEVSKEFGIKE